jgi:uncharacterized protein YbjT (DUF2867 family)
MTVAARLGVAVCCATMTVPSAAPQRIALVAGANGLVGAALLRVLSASGDYARVVALSRRPLSFEAARLVNRIIPRFEQLETELRGFACHDAYCCIGTTRAAAGSDAAFRAVDHDLVLRYAAFARGAGARTLVAVSSVGADPASGNFYLRTKGEAEQALEKQGWPSLNLVQPGLLLGSRPSMRVLEFAGGIGMRLVNPLLVGNSARFRAIDAGVVAAAMLAAARVARPGVNRLTWPALQSLAYKGRMPPRV